MGKYWTFLERETFTLAALGRPYQKLKIGVEEKYKQLCGTLMVGRSPAQAPGEILSPIHGLATSGLLAVTGPSVSSITTSQSAM